jgi:ElaA protein
MNLHHVIKHFDELTTRELYALLRLRNEVFIIEQNCPYLDLDEKDFVCYHVLYYAGDQLAGHTRLVPGGVSYEEVSIGRVATGTAYRGIGLGRKLMEVSINGCYEKFGHTTIRISAQYYLLQFYQSLGFREVGEVYDEDGIPHIEMLK